MPAQPKEKPAPKKPAVEPEPIPICLTRKEWDEVITAMKRSNASLAQMNHIRTWAQQEGEMVVIDIKPDGAKWLGSEVMRGTAIGNDILGQHWFWTKLDHSIFDRPGEHVFVICTPFESCKD